MGHRMDEDIFEAHRIKDKDGKKYIVKARGSSDQQEDRDKLHKYESNIMAFVNYVKNHIGVSAYALPGVITTEHCQLSVFEFIEGR